MVDLNTDSFFFFFLITNLRVIYNCVLWLSVLFVACHNTPNALCLFFFHFFYTCYSAIFTITYSIK